jgi:hypothetical protein
VGTLWLFWTAAILAHMRQIPNVPCAAVDLQLAAGACSGLTFILSGLIQAAACFRLDRSPEITLAFNDFFCLSLMLLSPPFIAQEIAFTYAALIDSRPNPILPKPAIIGNFISSIVLVPPLSAHAFKSGPLAWNGAVNFWVFMFVYCVVQFINFYYLVRAMSSGMEMHTAVAEAGTPQSDRNNVQT